MAYTGSTTIDEFLNGINGIAARLAALEDAASQQPTPMVDGVVAWWDPASLSLADGAPVTTWADKTGGVVAAQTGDSGASHTFVANSGGLPAVRLSGVAVLATTGTNVAATAMTSSTFGVIIVSRNQLGVGSGQANPVIVSSGDGTNLLFQATPTQTGRFQRMYDCGDAGMRSQGYSTSSANQFGLDNINGTAITVPDVQGGQIYIGGWKNAGSSCCGRADILAILVLNRAPTAADFQQVHRRYCELLNQARPGGPNAKTVTFLGDSLTEGFPVGFSGSYPVQMVGGLALPWGTWHQLGIAGYTWDNVKNRTLPATGNVSAATGNANIICAFEFANLKNKSVAEIVAGARSVIDGVHALDPNAKVVFGTSTDDGTSTGVQYRQTRTDYNAYWDNAANRSGIDRYVRLHLDTNIGIQGAAPTGGVGNTYYQDDGLHLKAAGYALIDNGPYGFRSAVQALMAA